MQKYYLFLNWQALFSNIFHLFSITLTISEKKVHHIFFFLGFSVVFERKTSAWGGFRGSFHGHRKVFLGLFRGESGRERLGSGDTHIIIYIRGRLPDRFSFAEIIDINISQHRAFAPKKQSLLRLAREENTASSATLTINSSANGIYHLRRRRHPCGHAPIEAQHDQRRLHLLLRPRKRSVDFRRCGERLRVIPLHRPDDFSFLPCHASIGPRARPSRSLTFPHTALGKETALMDNAPAPCRHRGPRPAISYVLGIRSCRRFASSRGTKRSIYDRFM